MAGFIARLRERWAERKAARVEARKQTALDPRPSVREAHDGEATKVGEHGPTSSGGAGG
jgi:uncharacterized protein with von Willebrand factor type A (vWA) domain